MLTWNSKNINSLHENIDLTKIGGDEKHTDNKKAYKVLKTQGKKRGRQISKKNMDYFSENSPSKKIKQTSLLEKNNFCEAIESHHAPLDSPLFHSRKFSEDLHKAYHRFTVNIRKINSQSTCNKKKILDDVWYLQNKLPKNSYQFSRVCFELGLIYFNDIDKPGNYQISQDLFRKVTNIKIANRLSQLSIDYIKNIKHPSEVETIFRLVDSAIFIGSQKALYNKITFFILHTDLISHYKPADNDNLLHWYDQSFNNLSKLFWDIGLFVEKKPDNLNCAKEMAFNFFYVINNTSRTISFHLRKHYQDELAIKKFIKKIKLNKNKEDHQELNRLLETTPEEVVNPTIFSLLNPSTNLKAAKFIQDVSALMDNRRYPESNIVTLPLVGMADPKILVMSPSRLENC